MIPGMDHWVLAIVFIWQDEFSVHLRQVSSPPFPEQTSKNPATTTYKDVSGSLHSYGAYLLSCLPKFIQQFSVVRDELTLYVAPSALTPTLLFLRDHTNCQFKQLVDISGADYPSRDKRFEVVYHLLSVRYQSRIRVKTYADEVQGVPSAVEVFNSANWYEREVWDLYGVWFIDHPDLRRILTDYGFEGHPLRKDFPLTGYTEVRYSEEHKRVVYEPLQMTQAFRNYESTSPWEMLGDGKVIERPEHLKVPPPPPPPEEKKPEQKK
ncbi:putative NADH-ubiquinone oxidoreductase 30.4 kDa subunit, mitochondrial [Serendipita sp. 400]|nr:putative NADH-ubiquinone oxidoreductase 30.4 kDa subunit, mitochondrial [Serendipita sp. 400]